MFDLPPSADLRFSDTHPELWLSGVSSVAGKRLQVLKEGLPDSEFTTAGAQGLTLTAGRLTHPVSLMPGRAFEARMVLQLA